MVGEPKRGSGFSRRPTIITGCLVLAMFCCDSLAAQQQGPLPVPPSTGTAQGAPAALGAGPSTADRAEALSASYVTDFLATSDGLTLAKAFMRIGDSQLSRSIVRLVEEIAPEHA